MTKAHLPAVTSALLGTLLASAFLLPAAAAGRDSDGDGLRDGFEARYGVTDPGHADSDGDGVIDAAEDNDGDRLGNLGEQRFRTHPGLRDSDGDGRPDGREDHDRDGRSNASEQDQRRLPPGLRPSLASAARDVPGERQACQTQQGIAEPLTCELGVAESGTTVVLMGDSHATMYIPALRPLALERGWRLVTLIKSACPPTLGLVTSTQYRLDGGRSCDDWRRNAIARLAADPPSHIIIAHSDAYKIVDDDGRAIPSSRRPGVWNTGLRRTLTSLPPATRVIVLGDVPTNRGNPILCLRKHQDDISACAARRELRGQRRIEAALRQAAARKGARFRTLYGRICTYDPCPLVQGDVLMWRDGGHLTATFAAQLAPSLLELLGPTLTASSKTRR